jgi:hypothetical protein
MIKLIISLLTLCLISIAISLPLSKNWSSFLSYFFCFSVIQIIGYNLYSKYIEIKVEKIKNERIKEFSKQGLEIKCPCNKSRPMFIPVELNSDNYFKCGECEKNISVEVSAKAFLQTEMVDLNVADAALVEIYKKFKETK